MGIHSLPARQWGRLGLIALLGLTLALVSVSAGHAKSGHAVIAKKKKCKKGKKSAATAKKKHKCKKVHHVALPAPLVRATLTWGAGPEVDLHAFDASGNHAGWDFNVNPPNGGVINNIPSAHHNGDIGPAGGTESFTDDIYVLGGSSNREFGYVACLYAGPSTADYTAHFTGVSKGGTRTDLDLAGTPSDGSDVYVLSVPGGPVGPANPAESVCGLTP